jgi:hypothetical protein
MPDQIRTETVHVDQLKVHPDSPPIYQPALEATLAYMNGDTMPELRVVVAREVGIPEGYAPPAWVMTPILRVFEQLHRQRADAMRAFDVMERADGSLWSYDAPAMVAAYHAVAPNARVLVRVIGRDPAT